MSGPVVDQTTGEILGDGPRITADGETDPLDETNDTDELRRLAKAYRSQSLGLQLDLEGCEKEARNYRRKIKLLDDELKEQRMESPEAAIVRTIFNAWVNATDRNPKRTKLGPAREKAILARLREGHDDQRILRAVSIGVRGATTSNTAAEREALIAALRQATELLAEGPATTVRNTYRSLLGNVKVFDDLELICRNEVQLEKFAEMADRFDPPQAAGVSAAMELGV